MERNFRPHILYYPDSDGENRGIDAERKAVSVISSSEYVESVINHPPNSAYDRQGIDLTVNINDKLAIRYVYVQVKASKSVKREFKYKLKKRGLNSREERSEWMLENGFMLLVVGDRRDSEILSDFENQLIAIDNHWVTSRRDR